MTRVRGARLGLFWGIAFLTATACQRDAASRAGDAVPESSGETVSGETVPGETVPGETVSATPPSTATVARVSPRRPSPAPIDAALRAGAPISAQLAPGGEHHHTLELAAGDYVHLVVEQQGIDVASTLLAPDGTSLLSVDRQVGYLGPEPLMAVAREAGEHVLVVRAFDRSRPPGAYRVELRERRRASPEDRQRAEAAKLTADGNELERALELWQAVDDTFWQAETWFLLAESTRDADKARHRYERSAALFGEVGEARQQSFVLNQLGNLYNRNGEPDRAVQLFEQALASQRQVDARLGEAVTHINLGKLRRTQGRYHEAQQHYVQALDLLDERLDRLQRVQTLHNLGVLYRILHRDELAGDYLTRAVETAPTIGREDLEAAALNQLGTLWQQRGEPQTALDFHRQAFEKRRQAGNRRGEANTLIDLGLSYRTLDQLDAARDAYDQALAVLEVLRPPRPRLRAKVLLELGALEDRLDQPQAAAQHLEQAAELYRGFGDPAGEAESLYRLAGTYAARDRVQRARTVAADAVELVERVRLSAVDPELRSSFFSSAQPFFELLIELLMRSHREQPEAGYDALALRASERARARSLLDMLAEAGADIRRGAAPELLARERELQRQLNHEARNLRQLELDTRNRRIQLEAEQTLRELALDLSDVRSQIRQHSPRYAALTQPRPAALSEIRKQLAEEETLVEIRLGEETSFLWWVTHDALETYELPGRRRLESLARRAYQQLRVSNRPEHRASSRRFLCELSQTLLTPLADRLDGQRLVVVADSALQFLPFAALPQPSGDCASAPPLVVDHEIVYLPSASALAVLRRETANRAPAPGLVAALADPVFSVDDPRLARGAASPPAETPDQGLARLKQSRGEAEAVLALAPESARFSAFDFAASKDVVVDGELAHYRIVHFATHAVLDTGRPELSGLVFSRFDSAGRPREDAFLRVHELYNLNLPAELVVLSACNTALGQEIRGEGLVGLARGFMYAGARRLIVSLWNVSDASTRILMSRFYQGLLAENLTPPAALRQAQISLWRERPEPFFWAAFVLQGEWGPLPPWKG